MVFRLIVESLNELLNRFSIKYRESECRKWAKRINEWKGRFKKGFSRLNKFLEIKKFNQQGKQISVCEPPLKSRGFKKVNHERESV